MGQLLSTPARCGKTLIADSVETIHKITGQIPVGWNAYWMRNSINILETLQDLGFIYHIDEPSNDEPFHRRGARTGLRYRSLYISPERHRLFSLRGPESRRL